MIFKQWQEVLDGRKVQTRRIADRYKVGSVQSVTPKMYKPAIWWKDGSQPVDEAISTLLDADGKKTGSWDHRPALASQGYQPLKILILDKRREPVQALTEAGAIAEGIEFMPDGWTDTSGFYLCRAVPSIGTHETAVGCYAALWDSINTKKGLRWQDNPMVTVYTFEVVR